MYISFLHGNLNFNGYRSITRQGSLLAIDQGTGTNPDGTQGGTGRGRGKRGKTGKGTKNPGQKQIKEEPANPDDPGNVATPPKPTKAEVAAQELAEKQELAKNKGKSMITILAKKQTESQSTQNAIVCMILEF